MIEGVGDATLDQVIDAELSLLRPEARASRERLEELLDDDFAEIGASGRRWDRDAIIANVVESPAANVIVERMAARLVADQIALVTYETVASDRRVLRTSRWRERDGTWRCFFHQGTVVPSNR
jgi:hypothetical protein